MYFQQLHSCCLPSKMEKLEKLESILRGLLTNTNIVKDPRLFKNATNDAYIPARAVYDVINSNGNFSISIDEFIHCIDHIGSIKLTVNDDNNETLIKIDYSNKANIFKVIL